LRRLLKEGLMVRISLEEPPAVMGIDS